MKGRYVIAHDVGTSSTKAVLIDVNGNILETATVEYGFHYPKPGWVEQSPEDYWKATVESTKKIMSSSRVDPSEILGIVYTTQAMGIIPVSKNGKILMNNITWVDGRAEKQAIKLMNRFAGKTAFKSLVGIELTGKDVIPKLMWLKEERAAIYQKTDKIMDVNGYLKYRSTGRIVAEWSGACTYAFNLRKKDWEKIFFRIAGVGIRKLPELVKSVDIVGGLTRHAARELGLEEGTPVYGGCDDTQSAAIGTGATQEGQAHIYLGTSAWVGVTTRKVLKFKHGAACLQSADPEMNLLVGITESAGANLEWLIERFYAFERESLKMEGIYALMDEEASKVPPGSDHLIFTPWLLGERCPVSTTTTRGTIFNLSLEHTRGHFVRALAEGVAFNLRWIIENYEKDYGFKIDSLRVTGGGSQNKHWMQIFANIIQKKIVTTNQPKMAGAIGAAMCVFVGSGKYKSFDDVNRIVRKHKVFDPAKNTFEVYDKLFADYKNIYRALKETYIKANTIRFNQN